MIINNQQSTTNPCGLHQSPGSGNPTFGREAIRGESSRLQTQAPLHHQRPFGRTSTKEGNPPAVRASPPTTNHQPPTTNQ
ncbi:MAG: hypothetical protein ACHBN1_23585 [Heteroscytonema crispum UTEX LB 1556]